MTRVRDAGRALLRCGEEPAEPRDPAPFPVRGPHADGLGSCSRAGAGGDGLQSRQGLRGRQATTFEAELRFVAIPQDFAIPDSDEMFEAETMRALVRLGTERGRDPTSWRTKALRPGAPFQLPD